MAEEYKNKWSQAFCYSSLSFNLLLAKESGILNTLVSANNPLSSVEIAQDNNIRERYTREILGCLSSAKLIRVNTNDDGIFVYDLEAEAKKFLSEGSSIAYLNFVKILMAKYKSVRDCMDLDKPAVARYRQEYFDGVDEMRAKSVDSTISFILSNVPNLKEKLEKGISVIEFGAGKAFNLSKLASMFPASTFTASEVRSELVEDIQQKYNHIPNMRFQLADLCAMPDKVDQTYDWVLTVDVIHDLPHPGEALKGIRRVVKDDGVFTFVDMAGTGSHLEDVGDMQAATLYALSTFLCIPESFQSEDSEAYGAGWGKSTAVEIATAAGFDTSVVPIEGKEVIFIAKPV